LAQGFGSGQRLSAFSVILTLSLSEGEESPKETLRLRLRVTGKKKVTKRVILTLFFSVILTLSKAKGKNLHPFHQTGLSIRKFLRFAQDSASGY